MVPGDGFWACVAPVRLRTSWSQRYFELSGGILAAHEAKQSVETTVLVEEFQSYRDRPAGFIP
jgi:hypothetical protein